MDGMVLLATFALDVDNFEIRQWLVAVQLQLGKGSFKAKVALTRAVDMFSCSEMCLLLDKYRREHVHSAGSFAFADGCCDQAGDCSLKPRAALSTLAALHDDLESI